MHLNNKKFRRRRASNEIQEGEGEGRLVAVKLSPGADNDPIVRLAFECEAEILRVSIYLLLYLF